MTNSNLLFRPIIAAVFLLSLYGCSSAKQLTYQTATDLKSYNAIQVTDLNIHSDESNSGSDEANKNIELFYNESILSTLISINKKIIESSAHPSPSEENVLILKRKVNIHYGSRALRYWVGWGAGKGYATITITGKDNITGQEKYNDIKEFKLAMGMFGGSFEKMVKQQITLQLSKFAIVAK